MKKILDFLNLFPHRYHTTLDEYWGHHHHHHRHHHHHSQCTSFEWTPYRLLS